MKTLFVFLTALLSMGSSAFAQPDSLWSRTFGGSDIDECWSVQQTTNGGYILGGSSYSYGAGERDFWLVRAGANGNSLWSRTFGGNDNDVCHSIQQTTDGGYVMAGMTTSFGAGGWDFWLVKTDANGDSLWSRTFGESVSEECYSVQQTSDGGYILGGVTESGAGNNDFWLVKTDAGGTGMWSRTFGGSEADRCWSLQQTADGGYVLAGYTMSFGAGSLDFWLVKTDANGDSLWSRTFGGSGAEGCLSVQQTTDGGFVLGGRTNSIGAGSSDFWLVKTDSSGTGEWSRSFGGSSNDVGYSVQQTADGGYVLAGWTASFGAGGIDFWLVKTDANGDSLWSRTFGGNGHDEGFCVQQTTDGGYILGGYAESYGAGEKDFWLVKTGPDPASDATDGIAPLPTSISLSAYPNPFNPTTTISFTLPSAQTVSIRFFDVTGRTVQNISHSRFPAGEHELIFDGSALPSGIYFAQLQAGNFTQTRKIILLK